jgi:hypothetical protein
MQNTLKTHLSRCTDEDSLKSAIESVCAEFGTVRSLRIFPARLDGQGGCVRCFCLLELDSPEAQHALSSRLGGSQYGTNLAFTVDLDGECVT